MTGETKHCAATRTPSCSFPIGTTGFALLQLEKARQVCGECLVRAECLEFALDTNQDSGIWGGLSEEERRVIRRQRARLARRKATLTASS